ncbi:MAG: glycine zipper 2TM domain-containing protein [Sphingopyxis granuli]|uniref:glycine zipper 2TM domain-containing protein n=1 Tax=Sphingopyxis TaxID=165697 RepID=UPI000869C5FF|nr:MULTISPECIES: glycine zipper 2TM domain-containing protein [Sphingopyxis]ODU30085.1 MAG: hypothetical protein ABS88_06975 [Sphingopyxis sp. SCN 67-31]QUM73037.1 glycine zipper 2TM domain-containing protein [Sphingopyxis granuli]
MNKLLLAPLVAATALAGGCASTGYGYDDGPRRGGGWYADDHYRDGDYRERRLGKGDRIYRGRDGRYYCKRSDGTTGLIIGGIAGGALGNVIAPGDSKTLGTVLGAIGGAVAGRAIDKSGDDDVRCR